MKTYLVAKLKAMYEKTNYSGDFIAYKKRELITNVFESMRKDARDTFKPYKSGKYVLRDLFLQPFIGLFNLVKGLLMCFSVPVMIKESPYLTKRANIAKNEQFDLIDNVGSVLVLRGITQILSYPLTLLRIPVRVAITLFKSAPMLESGKGFRELYFEFEKTTDMSTQVLIIDTLKKKWMKADLWGQKTRLTATAFSKIEERVEKEEIVNSEKRIKNSERKMVFPNANQIKQAIEKHDAERTNSTSPRIGCL